MKVMQMKNNLWKKFAVAIALLATSSIATNIEPAQAETFIYRIGINDDFATTDGPEEATYQRPQAEEWLEEIFFEGNCSRFDYQLRCQPRQFDEDASNQDFVHSFIFQDIFAKQPKAKIASATLRTKLKSLGGNNDGIRLSVFTTMTQYFILPRNRHWYSPIRFLTEDNSWNEDRTLELELELGNLPFTANSNGNLLNAMKAGFLDVHIEENTMVDYIELEIEIQPFFTGLVIFLLAIIFIEVAVLGLDVIASKANAGKKKQ